MRIERKEVEIDKLKAVSRFAKDKHISRARAYKLIDNDKLDYMVIDRVVFIYLNEKSKSYVKQR